LLAPVRARVGSGGMRRVEGEHRPLTPPTPRRRPSLPSRQHLKPPPRPSTRYFSASQGTGERFSISPRGTLESTPTLAALDSFELEVSPFGASFGASFRSRPLDPLPLPILEQGPGSERDAGPGTEKSVPCSTTTTGSLLAMEPVAARKLLEIAGSWTSLSERQHSGSRDTLLSAEGGTRTSSDTSQLLDALSATPFQSVSHSPRVGLNSPTHETCGLLTCSFGGQLPRDDMEDLVSLYPSDLSDDDSQPETGDVASPACVDKRVSAHNDSFASPPTVPTASPTSQTKSRPGSSPEDLFYKLNAAARLHAKLLAQPVWARVESDLISAKRQALKYAEALRVLGLPHEFDLLTGDVYPLERQHWCN